MLVFPKKTPATKACMIWDDGGFVNHCEQIRGRHKFRLGIGEAPRRSRCTGRRLPMRSSVKTPAPPKPGPVATKGTSGRPSNSVSFCPVTAPRREKTSYRVPRRPEAVRILLTLPR